MPPSGSRPPRGAVDRNKGASADYAKTWDVGPRAGPWIETLRGAVPLLSRSRRPPRGAVDRNSPIKQVPTQHQVGPRAGPWIETRARRRTTRRPGTSAPARGRGSKPAWRCRRSNPPCRPPRGAVDRNAAWHALHGIRHASAPARGRGSKQPNQAGPYPAPGRPPRGAVDRNKGASADYAKTWDVGPRAGPWIETLMGVSMTDKRAVGPRAGPWIETGSGRDAHCRDASAPARGRGSKQRHSSRRGVCWRSSPARGRGSKRLSG